MKQIRNLFPMFFLLGMLLGVKNGYLALWKEEDPQPAAIFPVAVSSLPLSDQILLHRGIQIQTDSDLQTLLEDYL